MPTTLHQGVLEYVDRAIMRAIAGLRLAAGTVVMSPLASPTDPLMVIFDGSDTAVPVKMIRAFNVFPDARVALAQIGKDWVAIGVFIDVTQANIVAGIPGMARFEFDPYTVNGKIYDAENNLVVELDQTTGVTVYDPQGVPGNRVRMVTELLQYVLSQVPGDIADYYATRLVTYKINPGAANEYIQTLIENASHRTLTDLAFYTARSERLDGSLGPEIVLNCHGDLAPGTINFSTDGVVNFNAFSGTTEFNLNGFDTVEIDGTALTTSTNSVGGRAVTSGSDDTTSASYVNLAGTGAVTSFVFTKQFDGTAIELTGCHDFFTVTSTASAMFGARINSVDYDIVEIPGNTASHSHRTAIAKIAGGVVPAGNYTVQGRWKRVSGTGTCRRNTDDWYSLKAAEVPA